MAEFNQIYRPQYHFSPREHWTNDPNGLVYFDGEYHLFFQFNPFGDQWGHMSWGHAVSHDLIHWEQLPVALGEEDGVMIYTGSVVIDTRNTSGFCSGQKPCMVAIYTGDTSRSHPKKPRETQNLAYSNDRGRTWTKYHSNPVLDLDMSDFRDPKVFWHDQTRKWLMAVALPNQHEIRFYGSRNLKQWELLSDFGPSGATSGQWECPDLFSLPVDGTGGERRWILKVGLNPGALQGGSGEQYFVGQFDGARFTNENSASFKLWTDYGKDCYCALTFNGLPREHPPLMMGWMDNWQYAAALPTSPWRGQMTLPRQLSLKSTVEGIRLVQKPFDMPNAFDGEVAGSGNVNTVNAVLEKLSPRALAAVRDHRFILDSEISLGTAQEIGWKLLGSDGHQTLVGYNRSRQNLFFDRSHSGVTGFNKDFAARTEAPLRLNGDRLNLRIFVDRCSVEVFANDGQIAMTNLVFPEPGAQGIELYANNGQSGPATFRLLPVSSIQRAERR